MKAAFDSDFFNHNMAALKACHPELHRRVNQMSEGLPFGLEIIQTPAGQANAIATATDGTRVAMYPEQDIFAEMAKKISDWQLRSEDFLFFVGLGLGYLPLVAAQTVSSQPRIVVFEPNLAMLRLAIQTVDLRELFAYERLDLHVGPELKVAEIIGQYGDQIFFGNNRLVGHGPSRLLFGDDFTGLEAEIVENIHVVRNIGYTAKHGGAQIFANTMENLSSLLDGPDLAALAGRFAGCPAICVAAGPSLDKDLDVLKTIGNRALIICGDSAVRSLVDAGIRPHIVVTTDMNPVNFEKMRTSLHCLEEAVLLFSIEANPDNVGTFPGKRKITVTAHNAVLNDWLGPAWSMAWQIPAMTSVSHTALFAAIGLGAGPNILVGMDFAYSAGKSHASGSVFRYPANPDDLIEVQGVCGLPVSSLPQLSTDRKQIENVMAQSTVRFIDSSLDGALIRGAENRSLQEVVDTLLSDDIDVSAILEAIDWQPKVNSHKAVAQFTAMQEQVEGFLQACGRHQARLLADKSIEKQANLATLRAELADFECAFQMIVNIVKIVRYGDIKESTALLNKLETDPTGNSEAALDLYAGIYGSLQQAATVFNKKLQRATDFFAGQNQLQPPSSLATVRKTNLCEMADHYQRHGCTAKAAQTWMENLQDNPDDINAWTALVGLFAEKRVWSLALRYAKQMQQHCSADPRAHKLSQTIDAAIASLLDEAQKAMDEDRVDEARQFLFEYHGLQQADDRSLTIQRRIESADRNHEKKMERAATMVLSDEQIASLHHKAQACIASRDVEAAVGIHEGLAQAAVAAAWQSREAIGDIRLSQNDGASAAWHYQRALVDASDHTALEKKMKRAAKLDIDGNHQKTKVPFMKPDETKAPAASSGSPTEHYQQAQQAVQEDKVDEAITILKELVASHPDFALAHNDLAVLFYNQGKTDHSLEHYQEAVRIEPDNVTFKKNLADFVYFVNGDARQALTIYVKLLKKNPEDKEILLALGQICVGQGEAQDAALFFQRVLALEPDNADARAGLDQLPGQMTDQQDEPHVPRHEKISASPPSTIIQTEVALGDQRHGVQIPEQETFRIQSIFDQNEYGILERRRHQGTFTVWDVGANVGLFALRTIMEHPKSRIHCFEPSPLAQQLLSANVAHFQETVIHNQGLFNKEMETDLHVHRYNTGQNSIRFAGQHHGDTVTIALKDAGTQFDALGIDYLDVLKIDTEGCEVEILESLGDRLERVDYVLLEYHSEIDRRRIDQLLSRFHLFGAQAIVPGVGTVKYVHLELI